VPKEIDERALLLAQKDKPHRHRWSLPSLSRGGIVRRRSYVSFLQQFG
jgi:hypothetical protein